MTASREVGKAHLDALMYRMLGGLLLFGAAVMLALTLVLLTLPRVETVGGRLLVLPGMGGQHTVAMAALPILGSATLLLGLPGMLALALGRRHARFIDVAPRGARRAGALRRPLVVLCGGLALLAIVLLRR